MNKVNEVQKFWENHLSLELKEDWNNLKDDDFTTLVPLTGDTLQVIVNTKVSPEDYKHLIPYVAKHSKVVEEDFTRNKYYGIYFISLTPIYLIKKVLENGERVVNQTLYMDDKGNTMTSIYYKNTIKGYCSADIYFYKDEPLVLHKDRTIYFNDIDGLAHFPSRRYPV